MSDTQSTDSNSRTRRTRTVHFSPAVRREVADLPEVIRDQFLASLELVSHGSDPFLEVRALQGKEAKGILELKINGRPAYRLMYTLMFSGFVVVLAARIKTKNGTDQQLIEVAASRLKSFRDEVKKK